MFENIDDFFLFFCLQICYNLFQVARRGFAECGGQRSTCWSPGVRDLVRNSFFIFHSFVVMLEVLPTGFSLLKNESLNSFITP
jgi:hypothetical protein